MTRLILVAAGALLLATASAPPPSSTGAYPACSAKIKDRCIQRHERGTYRGHHAPAAPAGGESELSSVVAAPAPASAAAPAAADSSYAAAPAPKAARPAPAHARAYRIAMRAGERG
jgi:hypothetical protein